jgi:hypothetical protein
MFSNYAQYDFLTAEMRAQHGGIGGYPATTTFARSALLSITRDFKKEYENKNHIKI